MAKKKEYEFSDWKCQIHFPENYWQTTSPSCHDKILQHLDVSRKGKIKPNEAVTTKTWVTSHGKDWEQGWLPTNSWAATLMLPAMGATPSKCWTRDIFNLEFHSRAINRLWATIKAFKDSHLDPPPQPGPPESSSLFPDLGLSSWPTYSSCTKETMGTPARILLGAAEDLG
jgi:hypothetical protein